VLLDVGPARGIDHANRLSEVRRFARSVPPDGYVVALDRNEIVAEAVREAEATVEWISLERGSSWWGADLREDRGRYRFRAFHRGRFALEVRLQVPGRRNVLSALAAVAACDRLAVPPAEIKQGLEEFAGLSRDFESRGSYRGVTLVDDAGGDPSSVFEALAIARQVFGPRRIWAVYRAGDERVSAEDEPGFHAAFAAADQVLVAGGSRVGSCEAGSDPLVRALVSAGVRARAVAGLEEAISELDRNLEPGDVLVTLGSGEVGTIADAFIRRLPRDRQGR
jgi:UDP-N-acetylmuramate--alanine ligase